MFFFLFRFFPFLSFFFFLFFPLLSFSLIWRYETVPVLTFIKTSIPAQLITNLQASVNDNTVVVQWDHDKGTVPCSDYVDYVLQYTLTNIYSCPEPFSPQEMSVTSTDKEYTINNLVFFSEYNITVSTRHHNVKYEYTAKTTSVVTQQAGKMHITIHEGIYSNLLPICKCKFSIFGGKTIF